MFRNKSIYHMIRTMAAQLAITSKQARQDQHVTSKATVTSIEDASKTVKLLTLKVHDSFFEFKPGQWVDFFKPGSDTVAGYSICSTMKRLKSDGVIDLAVKKSDHEVTAWVHNNCKVGSEIRIRSGGEFYYDPKWGAAPRDVLLIAGGVGINPLLSIFDHLSEKRTLGSVTLLYSAQTSDELIFKERIVEICSRGANNVEARFFTTKENSSPTVEGGRRIGSSDVRNVMAGFTAVEKLAFVCGPREMLFAMEALLMELGFERDEIKYETWW